MVKMGIAVLVISKDWKPKELYSNLATSCDRAWADIDNHILVLIRDKTFAASPHW